MNGDEARRLAISDAPLDYAALGFMCGLEIHQQLDTRKLFSPAPSGVVDPDDVATRTLARYDRRLRATQSELGETDPAAVAEAKKRKAFRYLAIDGLTSLVELDEEPPHPMSDDALDVTLTFAGLLGSRPADEVHIMRKTVIDGSNTSGFQRTSLVATGGSVQPDTGGAVSVWTVAVEEDSARKVDDLDGRVTYTLDRLGVPLIEVATGPDITDPKHAQATARRLGALLRATGRVRRGLGSIRQDLNVSIGVGDRVEIKGCQDLRAVPTVIEKEVRRQLWLHHVAEALKERGFTADALRAPVDVSSCFANTGAKMVASNLKKGGKVLALKLPLWAGLIEGHEGRKDLPRYGSEFAAHAKVAAGVKGVFHSDELPAYGLQDTEVQAVAAALELSEQDGFVLCVEQEATAVAALEGVAHCAADALRGAGRAVRAVQPDDSTRYMRPLPGAARMYPETDVPPIRIPATRWEHILANLPPLPEERIAKLVDAHGLSHDGASQLVANDQDAVLIELAGSMDANLAARMLLQVIPDLQDGERAVTNLPILAQALADGRFAKEGLDKVLQAMDGDASLDVDGAITAAGAEAVEDHEVDAIIAAAVAEREDFVKERGMGAIGPLMGPVMGALRGKVDGQVVSAKLKAAIERTLQ